MGETMKVVFRDINQAVISALLAADPSIDARVGSIFDSSADAVVSPANSFGFMDGGIDAHYTARFGTGVQERLRAEIKESLLGELLVGQAKAISTDLPDNGGVIKWVISAPTMRVPMQIVDPIDIFLACRAAVYAAVSKPDIAVLAFPGMGTGCGAVAPPVAAKAMLNGIRAAASRCPKLEFGSFQPAKFPLSWKEAQSWHFVGIC